MDASHPMPEIVSLLDRLDEEADSPELLRQIQDELEDWIKRHCPDQPSQVSSRP
jgi:hypothetical protein